jgi:predicted LPLAT superfamily acyltransferase
MIWMALSVGRPVARALLYPICAYYLVFSRQARRAIRPYLIRALGRPVGWRDLFRQYHCFASTILDRVYLLAGQDGRFDIDIRGLDLLKDRLARGRGCLLLCSHLGSFEVVRAIGDHQRQSRGKRLERAEASFDCCRAANADHDLGRGDRMSSPVPRVVAVTGSFLSPTRPAR